ncbi:hypothetical protein ACSYAD_23045 [Acaryochloris marina NIES-2412]|uniref:hypothetical protein n=1 Tax=Acaryochloris marina TaxID=155978 RepID=UPI004059DE6F
MSEKQVFKTQRTVQENAENSNNGHNNQGYAPEQIIIRLLGSVLLSNGKRVNIYSTVSQKHVLVRPLNDQGSEESIGTPTKITDLSAQLRRRLGC